MVCITKRSLPRPGKASIVLAGLVPWAASPRTGSVGIHVLPGTRPVLGPRGARTRGPGTTTFSQPFQSWISALLIQHLHRILQASPHSIERCRQRADFVVAGADVLLRIEFPQADAICHLRDFDDRLDHKSAQQHVDDDDYDNESARQ